MKTLAIAGATVGSGTIDPVEDISTSALLLESGDNLLLESDDRIILE